ncbi:MAG: 16S rRNA (guanine(966)-N(2))-methyltransferase RsmD [Clostridia bacterium]|nr:16S rRNA (guanine(966)-N(2))-methyltransferase RsmD [Clostridia bacterium]
MMRIITGSARGTHLYTLAGDATRPTSERAKEALFSMLQQKPHGARVLDLFAGSGQLGLEALSRGAAAAVFVDGSREAAEIVRRNAEKTHLLSQAKIETSDALSYLKVCREASFDLCFLDPPYAAGLLPQCLSLLLSRKLLAPGAIVVTESGAAGDVFGGNETLASQFHIIKQNRYGVACITVMKEAES